MVTATQANRSVRVTTPFGPDVLLFKDMVDASRLSQPFRIDLGLLSEKGDLDADRILGEPVAVELDLADGSSTRHFHGLVAEFAQTGYEGHYHQYQATVRPWFWFLSHAADCRIFQNKTVPEIFEAVVKKHGFTDFQLKLTGTHQKIEFCVQYRETDLNFLSRLLEHEGIYYFFEHTADKHTMVLVDSASAHKTRTGYESVPYFPPTTQPVHRTRDHLTAWTQRRSVQPGAYATTDFDFESSTQSLLKASKSKVAHQLGTFEVYDYPAEIVKRAQTDATPVAKLRGQELRSTAVLAEGRGDAAGLTVGDKFALEQHPRESFNGDYVILASNCTVSSDAYRTSSTEATLDCGVTIEAFEATVTWAPPRLTPKPVIHGAQTAMVVGKKGEEIDTDKYGRVKVQFHWDREGKKDENSSCFVRVAQVWAGANWGAMHIPRIGQEVIVHFLEGDPDQPIITGRVYNGQSMPPYGLPANATQSGIKSRSSKQGAESNFNEIRFEDKKGSEELFAQAEKDLKIHVKNDETRDVGHDRTTTIKNDDTLTVENDRKETIENDETLEVGKDRNETIKANDTLDVGKTLKIKAGDEIMLETGESKIVMKKDGTVTITCMKLKIDATQELKASSMQVKVDGQVKVAIASGVQLELKGTMTKVEGSGMLDLASTGMAKLKGSLTMIG
jgi:type VI secretion system secreted protein VgrG